VSTAKQWSLWQAPLRVIALVLCVDTLAATYGIWALAREHITGTDLLRLGLLALLSVAYLEVSRQVEHRRRLFQVDGSSHMDMVAVWAFPGALVLPRGLAALLVVFLYAHLWTRSWKSVDGIRLHRITYTGAVAILICAAVATVAAGTDVTGEFGSSAAVVIATLLLAAVTYRVVNAALISSVIFLSRGASRPSNLFGSVSDNVVEFATLGLGAMSALALVRVPWFAVMILPAVFLLQYHALLRDLVQAATMDAKTELLNAAAWRQLAQRELGRAARQQTPTAVLVIDMDRFKHINDTHGHLAGDTVLRSVADVLADELRGYDAVGRFGGEEFVALLPGADAEAALAVAERLRRRVEATEVIVEGRNAPERQRVHVTASVGVAATLSAGTTDLDYVLRAADDALYAAKHGGRNTVRVAPARVAA
jgi:diguanylate cyclase (GGDEF)-like protein